MSDRTENPAEKDLTREYHFSDAGEGGIFDGTVNQALQSYLRELGNIPRLTAEEQANLARQILTAENDWRRNLYALPDCVRWQKEYLAGKDPSQWREQFMPSCLEFTSQPDILNSWLEKIDTITGELHRAFRNNDADAVHKYRAELVDKLFQCKFSSDILMNYYDRMCDALEKYNSEELADFAAENCCTPEELNSILANAWQARQDLLELRKKMVEGNLRLVIRIVNQYSYRQLSISDLVQEGNLGLMRSLEKFDFNLKHKFSTYAGWWIRQSIGRAIAEQFRVIRIPAHMVSTIAAINRAEQRFILEYDRMPEVEEIAAVLEMPAARVSAIRKMARQTISLQSPVTPDENGSSLEDVLPDEQALDPARAVSGESIQQQLKKLLDTLSERERQILKMRFGLLGECVHTLQEISEHFSISRERVRQLELQILNKLRTPENMRLFGSHDI